MYFLKIKKIIITSVLINVSIHQKRLNQYSLTIYYVIVVALPSVKWNILKGSRSLLGGRYTVSRVRTRTRGWVTLLCRHKWEVVSSGSVLSVLTGISLTEGEPTRTHYVLLLRQIQWSLLVWEIATYIYLAMLS